MQTVSEINNDVSENESENVFEVCNINKIPLDIDKLKKTIADEYLTPSRKKYYNSTPSKNIILEDGYIEYLTAECMDGQRVGQGNCPIDIKKDNMGIDIACLCLNSRGSNEKSITQNFKDSNELEEQFKNKKDEEAVKSYGNIWRNKLNDAKKQYNLDDIFYITYFSNSTNIYILLLKININAITNMKSSGFTTQEKSINIKNIIDERYGNAKLYKSKKRIELRFHKNILDNPNTYNLYHLNFNSSNI